MSVVSLNERRKYPRISDAIALRLDGNPAEPLNSVPTHVVKMSCGGLRFVHKTAIDTDTNVQLCIHLPSSDKTIHIASRVVSSGEEKSDVFASTKSKRYYVQVEFLNIDQNVHQLLADHVDYVLSKTGMSHRVAIPA